MSFRIRGLDPAPFLSLYGLSDPELADRGARRVFVDASPGYPDRIEVRDMAIGEAALLLNYEHQPAPTAYRSAHAIFVREGATAPLDLVNAIPAVIARRPISLRAFDAAGEMLDGELCDGGALIPLIDAWLARPEVDYLHAHYARRGCYAARIERA
ncbi:DUF1203 domain-containing protein [Sphingomonas yantingensis]|uniref:DUF1203 domain-containing protein n=2 Tax=Sphingomonas TaxID=13687 RepID=A0A7W9EJ13_9SPHN|nr:DUF1203 domain-containing protein [Sphingomonas yantingensis]MBB5699763.1 hypothetical protein [Sphingomonas yantingensis]HCB76569.1 DUF1203 domain-containing protein [Sphingomonas bacterium]